MRKHIGRLETFAIMTAALAHDIDHLGLNNAFLVAQAAPPRRLRLGAPA